MKTAEKLKSAMLNLKNETAGRVEIGGEAALLKNFVVGGFGNYTFGSGYSGFAVGGNVRYTW